MYGLFNLEVKFFLETRLVVGFATASGKRDCISDISETSSEENHEVKPKTESRMLDRSMPAKI